jgi:probable blue pigment (indigoidine) exporter
VLLFVVIRIKRLRITWTPELRRLAALGVLNPGLAYALGLLGLASISASMSVLIWATEPVLIVLLAAIVLREHVSPGMQAALATAVLGVLLVVYEAGAGGAVSGTVLTSAAVGACAIYTVAARRLLVDDASLVVAAVQQATALVFAVLLLAGAEIVRPHDDSFASVTATTWMWAALSGLLYYGVAFWLYLSGLSKVSASVAGSFIPLTPVFGVAGALVIGEQLSGRQWVGAAVVVSAVTFIAVTQARRTPIDPPDGRGVTLSGD